MARRRAIPTIAFLALPVAAASWRYLRTATSSPATHLQAASTSTVRSRALPDLSNPPSRRLRPLWTTCGASPTIWATWPASTNRPGSCSSVRKVIAVIGPTPGTVWSTVAAARWRSAWANSLTLRVACSSCSWACWRSSSIRSRREPQLRVQGQAAKLLDRPHRPVGQAGRLGEAVLQEERLDLLLDRAGLAHQLLPHPDHLAVSLLLGGRDPDRAQQSLLGEGGQLAAVEPVALGLLARQGGDLRRGDHLGVQAGVAEATYQGEAGGAGLVDDLDDLLLDRQQPLHEELRAGGLDPGGDEPTDIAEHGDVVGVLVDVDADVHELTPLEAESAGRRAGGGGHLLLGHSHHLRRETSETLAQVCLRAVAPVFMLSLLGDDR